MTQEVAAHTTAGQAVPTTPEVVAVLVVQVSKTILVTLAFVLGFLFANPALAQVSPVLDTLNLLTKAEQEKLNKKLAAHKVHVGVVIKYSENIEEDALNYGRGPHGVDVVVWYSPKHTKDGTDYGSKLRLEVGTYKEGDLTDLSSNEILNKHVRLIKEKKYYEFFNKVSDDIYQKLGEASDKTTESEVSWWWTLLLIIGWIILFFICPNCALFLLVIFSSKNSGSSGSFSGGGSSKNL